MIKRLAVEFTGKFGSRVGGHGAHGVIFAFRHRRLISIAAARGGVDHPSHTCLSACIQHHERSGCAGGMRFQWVLDTRGD